MKKRMFLTVGTALLVIVVLGLVKFFQVRAAIAEYSSFQPPPEAVTTVVAHGETWPDTLSAVGSVVAVQGVTVSADMPGIVEKIVFTSGATVRKGDLLVQLDTGQERAQLAAAESQRRLSAINLERMRGLRKKGVIAQAELDRVEAEALQTSAQTSESKATIERKVIRAPFSGTLGIRQVNLGQYLNPGDPVVSLQTLDPIYVQFSVPQQELARLRNGAPVRVTGEGLTDVDITGRITAFDSLVDAATRNVQVQATFDNPRGLLRPGMFVDAQVLLGSGRAVVPLPASAVSYAPYGDSVFIVEEMKGQDGKSYRGVRQQMIKLGGTRGDQVGVVSGLKPGEEVVTSGAFKLRQGAAVVVNNQVQPTNNPTPQPEDS
jgi:membrane fusion protein (multidrug efflux system)